MSLSFPVRFDFDEAEGFEEMNNTITVHLCGYSANLNYSKLRFLSPAIRATISCDIIPSDGIDITDNLEALLKDPNNVDLIFSYINGSEIHITTKNVLDINRLAYLFHFSQIIEISTPLLIFVQQMKLLRKAIIEMGITESIIKTIAILFPLIQRLPIESAVLPLLPFNAVADLIDHEKLFPISDDSKIRALFPFFEIIHPQDLLNYFMTHNFTLLEDTFEEADRLIVKLPEFFQKPISEHIGLQIPHPKPHSGRSFYEVLQEAEFKRCWRNFLMNLSSRPLYLTEDDKKTLKFEPPDTK